MMVLDGEMLPANGPLLELKSGLTIEEGTIQPVGITGTGTVAILNQGMAADLIKLPRINTMNSGLHLWGDIVFSEDDLKEAGKAIGSVRAGHITLCREADIGMEEVETAYMSGASGTYVDALKAQQVGMIPPRVKNIYQVGNTSLAMARDLVMDPKNLDVMSDLAKNLRPDPLHVCLFQSFREGLHLGALLLDGGNAIFSISDVPEKVRLPGAVGR